MAVLTMRACVLLPLLLAGADAGTIRLLTGESASEIYKADGATTIALPAVTPVDTEPESAPAQDAVLKMEGEGVAIVFEDKGGGNRVSLVKLADSNELQLFGGDLTLNGSSCLEALNPPAVNKTVRFKIWGAGGGGSGPDGDTEGTAATCTITKPAQPRRRAAGPSAKASALMSSCETHEQRGAVREDPLYVCTVHTV